MEKIIVKPFDDSQELRHEVIDACRRMQGLGYFVGTWGNIGVRITDGLLVTPSRVDYDRIKPDDLVVVSWDGERLKGHRLPSSEADLHRVILKNRCDLGVIIHSHSPWATSVAASGKSIPVIAEDMAQIIGGEVRCSRYMRGGRHKEMAQAAWEAMGEQSSAALLINHGALVGGRDIKEALVAAQVLEKAAMAFINSAVLESHTVIPPDSVRKERERYLYTYGTDKDFDQEDSSSNA